MVCLMDLWVASGLPGDFLDLSFEIVTVRSARAVTLEPERFARGHLSLATRELWRDDSEVQGSTGLCVRSIVVRPRAEPRPRTTWVRKLEPAPPQDSARRMILVAPYAVGYPFGACRMGVR
jgi:hypothetical protein